jgi:hypothetical protein
MDWPQLKNFHPDSRIWIYTADKDLSAAEESALEEDLSGFCQEWTAHNHQLKASSKVLFHRFVVLVVDETQAGASGCSIDKSVRFLRKAGEKLNTDFFGRSLVGLFTAENPAFVPFKEIPSLLKEKKVSPETKTADTTLLRLSELQEGFVRPLHQTWLRRYLNQP